MKIVKLEDMVSDGKKVSVGESIISEILQKYSIRFKYEKQVCVEQKKENDSEKDRLWYPDFYLEDQNMIIEYAGITDESYLEGLKERKKTYEKMGLKVIVIYGSDVFDGNRKKRPDFEEYLLDQIDSASKSVRTGLRYGKLETNFVEGYQYKSAAA